MTMRKFSKEQKWLIFGVSIIFVAASLLHFVYEWTGENKIIGLFVPVNESVWEHLKLVLLPIIIWWIAFYMVKGEKFSINKNKWYLGCIVSLVTSMLFILAFFYTYTEAFGIKSIVLDIVDTFLGILFGQILGAHIYKYSRGIDWVVSAIIILLIVGAFAWFTISPPELPIFLDTTTGRFGFN